MARVARISLAGCPYHVTHRGNHGVPVFIDDTDREAYLKRLELSSAQHGLRIWAYCLMPNHIHLIVLGDHERSMSGCLRETQRRHAVRINKRIRQTGHLWADRFYSTPMDDHHLWAAVRYVELNPVRARLVSHATEFPWSSARAHACRKQERVLDPSRPFPGEVEDWESWLVGGLNDTEVETIRRSTLNGRPCGSDAFVQRIEEVTGRKLTTSRGGRPWKPKPKPNLHRSFN